MEGNENKKLSITTIKEYINIIKADEGTGQEILSTVLKVINELPTYNITQLNDKVLLPITKCISTVVGRLCEINEMEITCGCKNIDYFQHNSLMIIRYLNTIPDILSYIYLNRPIHYKKIKKVHFEIADMLFSTVKLYKKEFSFYNDINKQRNPQISARSMNIFQLEQQISNAVLNQLESDCIIFNTKSKMDMNDLGQILVFIFNITTSIIGVVNDEVFDNFKIYLKLLKKYPEQAKYVNLLDQIKCIISDLDRNFQFISNNHEEVQLEKVIQMSAVYFRVGLRIFQYCFDNLENNCEEFVKFAAFVLNINDYYFTVKLLPSSMINFIEAKLWDPTLKLKIELINQTKLFYQPYFVNNLNNLTENHFGIVKICTSIFSNLPKNDDENFQINEIWLLLFNSLKYCHKEFYVNCNAIKVIITSTTNSILSYLNCYQSIEIILVKSILQNSFWSAMIAIEVWYLVLLKCSCQSLIEETMINLIQQYLSLDNECYIQLPVTMFMRYFIKRLFTLLNIERRNKLLNEYKPIECISFWNIIGFKYLTSNHLPHINSFLEDFYENCELISSRKCQLKDVVFLSQSLNVLSTIPYKNFNINTSKLLKIILHFWSITLDLSMLNKNVYKQFFYYLFIITIEFLEHIPSDKCLLLLEKLKFILENSHEYDFVINRLLHQFIYKSDFLKLPSNIMLINELLMKLLASESNPVVYEYALHTLSILHKKFGKIITFKNNNANILAELFNQMDSSLADDKYDFVGFGQLQQAQFKHKCTAYVTMDVIQPPEAKKIRRDTYNEVDKALQELKIRVGDLRELLKENKLTPEQSLDISKLMLDLRLL